MDRIGYDKARFEASEGDDDLSRIAGMLCSLGDANSITFKPIGGLTYLGQGFANDQIEAAIQNGVTSIAVSTNPAAPLRIERGLTTFTTKTDPTRPYDFFSDPRLVRLVDLFIRRMKEWGDNTMIGNVPVNDDSRTACGRGPGPRSMTWSFAV
jgi:hypothetical protein